MEFEEFEKKIWKMSYSIVGMNHYIVNGKRYTYCAVSSRETKRAFKSEGENSQKVFEDIYNQIVSFKKNNI